MSISSEIDRITQAVADSYSKAEAKGATMPASAVIANLPATIESIVGNIGAFENLFVPDLGTETQVGITCTDNGDGSYTLNGTATGGTARFVFGQKFTNGVTYKLCGGAEGSSRSGYMLYIRHNVANIVDEGNGVTFTADSDIVYLAINVNSGVTCNNVVFRPIITTNLNVTKDNWYPKIKSVENLFVPTVKTTTQNGLTITNNGDGTYTVNGTSTNTSVWWYPIGEFDFSANVTYKILGTAYHEYPMYLSGVGPMVYENGSIWTPSDDVKLQFGIRIGVGVTYNNIVFKPMITTNLSATYENFVKRVGGFNNLFVPTLATTTTNGVTCTNNGDGSYTLNGTATALTEFRISTNAETIQFYKGLGNKTVKLVGCPKGGSSTSYRVNSYVTNGTTSLTAIDYGEGYIFTIPENVTNANIIIIIQSGTVCNNLIFKPMVTESLLPEYYDFVKGIEAGKKVAWGTLYPQSSTMLTIPHNLGITPNWFTAYIISGNIGSFTQGASYEKNFDASRASTRYYRGNSIMRDISNNESDKSSNSKIYIGTDVITVPNYTYNWYTNGLMLWVCGE